MCPSKKLKHVASIVNMGFTNKVVLTELKSTFDSLLIVFRLQWRHKRNFASNTGGGGGEGAKLTMGIRNFILQSSRIW
jgi:hypothetical protein